ncbi:macrolide transporter subunit MacA [Paraburkholderia sabiae]|uniref:Macrolide transporter subunit MacA n=1 Tax=Paraburkholderia sabiae TaxID=273251 RepID=A0ABU9QLU4_9BURK|nr:macrolide transporter subunit MacA [Paraburkholderia sabiae]WJZ77313.1 macrolide transporter subunit MacA [Paraburkholderia sabiae]CAD6547944.1 Macrolide export protein MacA [Paraburkholderia sabiae]
MKKPSRRLRYVAAGILVAALAVLLMWDWFVPDTRVQYLTAKVERGDLENAVLATGTLQAFSQVDVGSQASGQLRALKVKLGDKVVKDQWLAEIDPVLSENALRQAHTTVDNLVSQRRATAAQLAQADLALARQRKMIADDATAHQDLESAQAAAGVQRATFSALDAQIRAARIQVETAQANLGYTRIVAPMGGEVVAIVTQEGQTVIAQQQAPVILKLANLDTMTVKAQISEADVIRVHPGQTAWFTILGAPDTRYYGRLRAIEPAPQNFLDTQTSPGGTGSASSKPGTAIFYNALFEVPNPGHLLRISMTAQVSVLISTAHDVLSVPVAALGAKTPDGRYAVRVAGADEQVQTRLVHTGLNNNVRVEIRDGLRAGERVVVGEAPANAADAPAGDNALTGIIGP